MTSYDDIWGFAEDNYGLITAAQAKELGVSNARLVVMAHRGVLVRVGHGVYQVKHHVPGEHDGYALGVAALGKGAYLRGASVLGLLKLVPTNLSVFYAGAPGRVRRQLDAGVRVAENRRIEPCDYFGIPCEPVDVALRSAKEDGALDWDKLAEAAEKARDCGYLTDEQLKAFREDVRG